MRNPDRYRVDLIHVSTEPVENKTRLGDIIAPLFVSVRVVFNNTWKISPGGRFHPQAIDVTREIVEWCKDTYGYGNFNFMQTSSGMWVLLRNEADAMLFKLAWNEE